MILLSSLVKGIDWLADRIGKVVSALAVLIMLTMTYEVTARYVFDRPTIWSYDITYMMGGTLFLLAAPFVLLHQGHVRVDLFYARYSSRVKRIVDLVLTPLLFFTALSVFVSQAWKFAFRALEVGETSMVGIWEPTMIPFRFIIAVGFSLFALEGVAWFLRDLFYVITGKEMGGKSHD